MKRGLFFKLFARFFWGIASDSEKEQVYESEESREMLKIQWNHDNMGSMDSREKDEMLHRLKQRKSSRPKFIPNGWLRSAAVLLILFTIGSVYHIFVHPLQDFFKNEISYIEKYNPSGQRSQIVLPDNSVVWLNAESRLTYPESFEDLSQRNIKLEGEAYFDVQRNESRPFVVNVDGFRVRVLGTEFNIDAYSDADQIYTTLVQGKVELTYSGSVEQKYLHPGEMGVFHRTDNRVLIHRNVNLQQAISWKDGKLIYDNIPFGDLAKELERWYGVDFKIDSSLLNKHRFTMTITDESLKEVCELIRESTPVNYYMKGNTVIFKSSK